MKPVTRKITILLFSFLVLFSAGGFLHGQTFRIGSIAPAGSPWDNVLRQIAQEWQRISNGRINVRIFAGGIAGDEDDMLRKVRLGQLDGAVLTTMGFNKISTDLMVLSLPYLIENDDELYYVMERMQPRYEQIMSDNGFRLLTWNTAGWVRFFTRSSVTYPEDLMRQRLGVTPGEDVFEQILKDMGFHVVPTFTLDMVSNLQSGLIDSVFLSPLGAAAFQVFGIAPHMLDLPIAPVLGGVLFSERTWRRIAPALQKQLIEAAVRISAPLSDETRKLEDQAFRIMLDNGLKVVKSTPEIEARWKPVIQRGVENSIGKLVSRDIYEEAAKYAEEYRALQGR